MKFRLLGGVKRLKKELKKQVAKFVRNGHFKPLVAQILVLSLFINTVPANAFAFDTDNVTLVPYTYDASAYVFDAKNSTPVVLKEALKVELKVGESRVDEARRVAARKVAVAVQSAPVARMTLTTVKTSEPDLMGKRALAQRAAAAYGVPWEIVEAVWQVESGKSWDTTVKSYAGAQGPAQFMPGTWRKYGVDADGDGHVNIHDAEDAVYASAHYLAASGANRGEIYRAIFAYNHADWYVQKVLGVARSIGYQG